MVLRRPGRGEIQSYSFDSYGWQFRLRPNGAVFQHHAIACAKVLTGAPAPIPQEGGWAYWEPAFYCEADRTVTNP